MEFLINKYKQIFVFCNFDFLEIMKRYFLVVVCYSDMLVKILWMKVHKNTYPVKVEKINHHIEIIIIQIGHLMLLMKCESKKYILLILSYMYCITII